MPILINDDTPFDPRTDTLAIESFNVAEESADALLEPGFVSRTGKVRCQSVPLQDDAGRALFDQKIRHRVEVGRANFERQMKPRFLHKVLCHSTAR